MVGGWLYPQPPSQVPPMGPERLWQARLAVSHARDRASSQQWPSRQERHLRARHVVCLLAGYSLNALVDFPLDNPIEIIKHLMIGSEGTFGFVSQVRLRLLWAGRARDLLPGVALVWATPVTHTHNPAYP